MARDHFNQLSLGCSLQISVKEARVLLVGAGGIGCELLKNLVLTGFGEIHIVDLDTIDLSNLNRQFLFRQEHIGKSKASVAADVANRFNPNVKLVPYTADITDSTFNLQWFLKFTVVFNALDNLHARRHVNKMCIVANVPLIESGTTGFNGQVQVIKRGVTACYDCTPKEAPKTYPICTIRSTPSQPIHCIVWAKSYLLNEIFGASEDESPDMDHTEDSENSEEVESLRRETAALRKIKDNMSLPSFPQLLFEKVYRYDVERLLSMDGLWRTRRAPEPLDYTSIFAQASKAQSSTDLVLKDLQRPWRIEENLIIFIDSLQRLSKRMLEMKTSKTENSAEPIITFDKDDEDTLDFVTASANLRSSVFGIECKSKFDVKQMAGNIIPAIATTNAIVAGLCVLQSFKVLEEDYANTKELFLSPFSSERLLASDRFQKSDPDCAVCSISRGRILVDVNNTTLNYLVENFLKMKFGYGDEITISNGENHLLYDIDETVNLEKTLSDIGIKEDSFLTVKDDNDHPDGPRVDLVLNVQKLSSSTGAPSIESLDIPEITENHKSELSSWIPRRKPLSATLPSNDKNDALKVIGNTASKRPLSPELLLDSTKKIKSDSSGTDKDALQIEDGEYDGAIVID
ncbi:Ubiquitin-activating enzyme E1-like [Golovinomyces cichoracearum]|uniref:Ubiquitin-activating enzyme E1-like n=1 Tax=Golovinomyces cichoracearum TaxID=62708 RepID=A0A420IC28_9PEZI|nr:Ubiquitin-activating enzyme E1-like [Golovinomyces cichoracearum]